MLYWILGIGGLITAAYFVVKNTHIADGLLPPGSNHQANMVQGHSYAVQFLTPVGYKGTPQLSMWKIKGITGSENPPVPSVPGKTLAMAFEGIWNGKTGTYFFSDPNFIDPSMTVTSVLDQTGK